MHECCSLYCARASSAVCVCVCVCVCVRTRACRRMEDIFLLNLNIMCWFTYGDMGMPWAIEKQLENTRVELKGKMQVQYFDSGIARMESFPCTCTVLYSHILDIYFYTIIQMHTMNNACTATVQVREVRPHQGALIKAPCPHRDPTVDASKWQSGKVAKNWSWPGI